jgi:hypothetical protein
MRVQKFWKVNEVESYNSVNFLVKMLIGCCNGYSPVYFTYVTSLPSTDLFSLCCIMCLCLYKLCAIKERHDCEYAYDTRHHH